MNILKKIFLLVVVISIISCTFAGFVYANETESNLSPVTLHDLSNSGEKIVDKLYCLGVLSEYDMKLDAYGELTRAEFVEMVINLLDYGTVEYTDSYFDDVPDDYWANGYINTAYQFGLISQNNTFRPTDGITYNECIKILLEAMGYGQLAMQQGGYPSGYLAVAAVSNINHRVSVTGDGVLVRKDVLKLLENALECNVLVYNNQKYETSDTMFMEERKGIKVYDGKIEEILLKEHKARISINGVTSLFDLSDKIDINSVIEDTADIYVSDEDVVLYIEFKGKTKVYYDFIYEINRESNQAVNYGAGTVKRITLRNEDKEFKVSEDAIIYCDDINAKNEAVPLLNTFAKIVVLENEVVKIESYNLKAGGIIYRADPDKIKYIRGDVNDNVIQGFEDVDDLRIFIDGKQYTSMYDLKDSMVFDYWTNSDQSKFIIVASSRIHEKTLNSSSDTELVLDGQSYEVNPYYGLYVYSNAKERYMLNGEISNYFGKKVKVFVDDNKYVRYIKIDENVENIDSFLGVITRAIRDDADESVMSFSIYKVSGDNGEKQYKVAKKLSKSSISAEYAASVAKNLDGKGFFKFSLNKASEIIKIEEPDFWGMTTTVSSKIKDNNNYWLDKLYVRNATIFAILDDDGEFKVKLLDWDANLRNTEFSEPLVVTSDYDAKNNPLADYVMLTGGVSDVHFAGTVQRFVTDVTQIYDEAEGEVLVQFTTIDRWGTYKHKISLEENKKWNLKPGMRLEATTNHIAGDAFRILSVEDFSVDPSFWKTDNETFTLNSNTGFYKADKILYRDGHVAQFMVNGIETDVIELHEYFMCYELQRGKNGHVFVKNSGVNPLGYINELDNVWFCIYPWGPEPRSIGYVIYEKTSMVP